MIIHLFKLIWVILALAIIVFIGLHSFSSEPLLCRFHATHCSSLTVTLCYLVGSLLLNGVLLLVKPGHADTTDFQRASKLTQFGRHRTVTVVVPIYSTGSSTKKVFFEYYFLGKFLLRALLNASFRLPFTQPWHIAVIMYTCNVDQSCIKMYGVMCVTNETITA